MKRAILLSLAVLALTAGPATADPVKKGPVFSVTCIVDGQQLTFQVVGTGVAGHILGQNGNVVLKSATITTFVNGVQVEQFTFSTPGRGLNTVPCTAFAEFEDEEGNAVRIEIIGDALITPQGPKGR
jgi:hypothetical protein